MVDELERAPTRPGAKYRGGVDAPDDPTLGTREFVVMAHNISALHPAECSAGCVLQCVEDVLARVEPGLARDHGAVVGEEFPVGRGRCDRRGAWYL